MSRAKLVPVELTKDDERILKAYRALDSDGKVMALAILRAWADDEPAPARAPSGIRLVAAAGKRVTA